MWIALALIVACVHRPASAPVPDEPDDRPRPASSAGVRSPALAAVLDAHWEASMRRSPEWATTLGDHRFDDQLYDASEAAERAWLDQLGRLEVEVVMMPDEMLSARDQVTRELLLEDLRVSQAERVCRFAEWNLSARSNELVSLHDLAEQATLTTPQDADRLLARYEAFPARVDVVSARLRQGAASGRVSNRASVERVVAMLDEALARPLEEWAPHRAVVEAFPDRGERSLAATRAAAESLRRYRSVLHDEILPVATTGDHVGLGSLPDGDACYRAVIREHTTLSIEPSELHARGLEELERIHAEMRELGGEVLGTTDLAEIVRRLREDPALRFEDAEQIRSTAEGALRRAEAEIPAWVALPPVAPCAVDVVPDYLAPYTTVAWYEPVRPGGERPGTYFVNTWEPTTRARFEAEVLAFHESVPGHHFQIGEAREQGELPAFRRYGGSTAFVEGWALYAERLADEMGLYGSDLDRLGMMSFDAWRASRLVVDTGIHAMGWSRERAEAFLLENTALAPQNVGNEVDRYITWPGQALAYKVGQMRIRALRSDAEQRLGPTFDLPGFHAAVLSQGAVSLPVLDRQIERWIEDREDAAL